MQDDLLDKPIYGALAIARAARLVDERGRVDVRRGFYALENKLIDADKFGRKWVTTLRRIRSAYMGGAK